MYVRLFSCSKKPPMAFYYARMVVHIGSVYIGLYSTTKLPELTLQTLYGPTAVESGKVWVWVCDLFSLCLGRPTLVGKALSFTHKLSILFLSIPCTALSTRAVDGHQIYSGGSIVGKASTIIRIEISPTHPLIFTGVKMCENWGSFQHYLTLSRLRLKRSNISERWNKILV